MEIQRTNHGKSSEKRRWPKYAAALALAAVATIGVCSFQESPKTVSGPPIEEQPAEMNKPKLSEPLADRLDDAVRSNGLKNGTPPDPYAPIRMIIDKELPYDSLNCASNLVSKSTATAIQSSESKTESSNPLVNLFDSISSEMDKSISSMGKSSIFIKLISEDESELFRSFCAQQGCDAKIPALIKSLEDGKDIQAIISVISAMDSKNIVWQGKGGPDSLFSSYMASLMDAAYNGHDMKFETACLARNAYALRLLEDSHDALSRLALLDVKGPEGIISQLPPDQRRLFMKSVMRSALGNDGPDHLGLLELFESLGEESKSVFLVAFEENLPENREAMEAILEFSTDQRLKDDCTRALSILDRSRASLRSLSGSVSFDDYMSGQYPDIEETVPVGPASGNDE